MGAAGARSMGAAGAYSALTLGRGAETEASEQQVEEVQPRDNDPELQDVDGEEELELQTAGDHHNLQEQQREPTSDEEEQHQQRDGDSDTDPGSSPLRQHIHPQRERRRPRMLTAHKRTRAVVERGIGQMKRRFHVLHGEVRLTPDKVCKVIMACAILHNICKARQIAEPLQGDGDEESDDDGMVLEQQVQQAGMVFERQQRAGWTLSDGRTPPSDANF
ncbi:hypothetical protein ABVT39_021094 [Epinephelus coioides]